MHIIEDLERMLDQLLKEPDNYLLLNRIGVLLFQIKDWEGAESYLQRAFQLNNEDPDILYNYALILYRRSQWQKAVTIFQAYLKLRPGDREVLQKAGDAYYQLGEYEKAVYMYARTS